MKKIVVLFALLIVGQAVFAAVDTQYLKTDKFLYNIGYFFGNKSEKNTVWVCILVVMIFYF